MASTGKAALYSFTRRETALIMTLELQTLADIVARLEAVGMEYMLTGSMALGLSARKI